MVGSIASKEQSQCCLLHEYFQLCHDVAEIYGLYLGRSVLVTRCHKSILSEDGTTTSGASQESPEIII